MISGIVELGRENDARLLRLQTALTLGSGFQLVIVEAEPGPIRDEVVRRIQTWTRHDSLGTIALIKLDPEATLLAQLASSDATILTGLEPPSPSEASLRDWPGELNMSRDLLPELVPGPLLLLVSQAVHAALFERAPDLYSWRRHAARFTVVARKLAFPLYSSNDPYWLGEQEHRSYLLNLDLEPSYKALQQPYLIDALLQLGDEAGASRTIDNVLAEASLLPSSIRQHLALQRVECALARQDLALAGTLLDEAHPATDWAHMSGVIALLRGKLQAAQGKWDQATSELERASAVAHSDSSLELLARARECLAQVELARGEIASARSAITSLIEVTSEHCHTWGTGMLLRLASLVEEIYPDEAGPLLDAALVAADDRSGPVQIRIRLGRAKRAALLGRRKLAHAELAQAKSLLGAEERGEMHAHVHFAEAMSRLLSRDSDSEREAVRHLARACELLRMAVPRQAAIAGRLLGELQARHGEHELAVAAYRAAAEDARRARAPELAADAELGELDAAVEGGLEAEDTPDRLRALAEQLRANDHVLREGIARAHLGRFLLRCGLREPAVAELERARACFAATADAGREHAVARLLEGSP